MLLNSKSKPISTTRYDAFGQFTTQGVQSPWLFTGQRFDTESNLYHFAKREYDPATGRFITPDPLGFADGPNLYAYVKNNPYRYFDPDGCSAWEFFTGMASSAINAIGVTLATRGAICAASAVCPPLGAALGVGLAAYSVGSLVYDHWDTLSHHASTYANEGFTAGNAELSRSISNTINEFSQASDFDKGDMTMSALAMFVGGKSGKTKARNVVKIAPDSNKHKLKLSAGTISSANSGVVIGSQSNGFMGRKGWELKQPSFQPVRNQPINIHGRSYTSHALDQMQNRGILPSVVENTIDNGNMFLGKVAGTRAFYCGSNNISVIINSDSGRVITTGIGQIRQ